MIIFEILFLVFIMSAEYAIYHYATKEYNNIKKNIKNIQYFSKFVIFIIQRNNFNEKNN